MQACNLNDNMTEEQFLSLPESARKRILARDVIQQIESGVFYPSSCYFQYDGIYGYNRSKDVIDHFYSPSSPCYVCGIGSLMVTFLLRVPSLAKADLSRPVNNRWNAVCFLKNVFSPAELDRIESAFEGKSFAAEGFHVIENTSDTVAIAFGQQYEDKKCRLLAIMENILTYGYFNPEAEMAGQQEFTDDGKED